jgi:hypothetical protein
VSGDFSKQGPDPGGGTRASDEDRERVVTELHDHTVAGRLSAEELEQRVQDAYSARTTAELDAVRRDLPSPPAAPGRELAERRALLRRRLIQETGGVVAAFAVGNVIWLAAGAQGQYWPVWILVVVVLIVVRSAWALYGPAPDLDRVERDLDARRERRRLRDERRGRGRLGP